MLSKKNRLPGPSLPQLKSQGVLQFFKDFSCLYLPNNLEIPRFGFIISKKIDKRAVVRNKLKRVFCQAVQQNLAQFKPGDYLFLVKRSALGADPDHLSQLLIELEQFQRLE